MASFKYDGTGIFTVAVSAETEPEARARLAGIESVSITAPPYDTEGDLGSTADLGFTCLSPRGPVYLVSAEDDNGQDVAVRAEAYPEPLLPGDLSAELGLVAGALARAEEARHGSSSDAVDAALHGLAQASGRLLDALRERGLTPPPGNIAGQPD